MKYRNQKTNGYSSKREANRAAELQLLLRAGKIEDLVEQPEYELIPKQEGERAIKYRADFQYFDNGTQKIVIEDVKGMRTPVYILKRKLMKYMLRLTVTEV